MPYGAGYPQQYGMPYPPGMYPGQMGMYPQAPGSYPSAPTQTPSDELPVIPVKLPDPQSTGFREPAAPAEQKTDPKPEQAQAGETTDSKQDPKAAPKVDPSTKAADIIKSYMHRRPNV